MPTRVVFGVGGASVAARTGAKLVRVSIQANEWQRHSYARVIPFRECDYGIRIVYIIQMPEGIIVIIWGERALRPLRPEYSNRNTCK